jgi:hypothetical protein
MLHRTISKITIRIALGFIFSLAVSSITKAQQSQEHSRFSREILPILSDRCFTCHGPDSAKRKADLRLDQRDSALKSKAIVPGKASESELIARITSHDPDEVMPPPKLAKPLSPEQVETLKSWINAGAVWGQHWAWEKPIRPNLPKTVHSGWVRNPVDAFIISRLESKSIKPQPEATRAELLRRVSLDLTGLPPSDSEALAFLNDTALNAYEKLVDRLLASPRFGERMAWDWLDAARYADTNGYQGDGERSMWPWRDWVVQAFNNDMPFDQFTVNQVAGDLIPKAHPDQILATGFNRNHMINGEGGRIAEENRVEYVFDQTETTSTIWLGLTMTCARCHDHKFDPISKRDYYQLFSFFNQTPVSGSDGSGQSAPVLDMTTPQQQVQLKKASAAHDALLKVVLAKESKLREAGMVIKDGKYSTTLPVGIESTLRKGPNSRVPENDAELTSYYGKTEPEYLLQLEELRKLKKTRDAAASKMTRVMVMADSPKPRETFALTRGTYDKLEAKVSPQLLSAFLSDTRTESKPEKSLNRLDLANWFIDPENPLTARVTVNRIWQMLFGMGIVKTTEDFGLQGQLPSHPELLDYLASEFQSPLNGSKPWSTKHIIRLILTSATYRQSASAPAESWSNDPENRLLGRGPRHRLPSWMIRDQALAISGLLTPTMGGPSVKSYQPTGIWEEATFGNKTYVQDHGDALYRRSLYLFWRRIVGPTIFFDSPNRQTCSVKSVITNTPLHALITLNDVTYVEAARVFAGNAIRHGGPTDALKATWIFQKALVRSPNPNELQLMLKSLSKQRAIFQADTTAAQSLIKTGESPPMLDLNPAEHAAWTQVCLMVLNLDETLSKP